MIGERKREVGCGLVVDRRALSSLDEIVHRPEQKITWDVTLKRGFSCECDSLGQLLKLLDEPGREVEALTARSGWDEVPRARVDLKPEGTFATVEYSFRGEERDVLLLSDALDRWIRDCRPWYWPIAMRSPNVYAVASVLGMALAVIPAYWLASRLNTGNSRAFALSFMGFFIAGMGPATYFVWRVRRWLFPGVTIAVGTGESRHKRLAEVRKYLVFTLALGALVAAVKDWVGALLP